jgi:hypothetical protein
VRLLTVIVAAAAAVWLLSTVVGRAARAQDQAR